DTVYRNVYLYVDCLRRAGSGAWPVVQMTVCDANAHEVDDFLAYWRGKPVSQALALNCTGRGGERPFTVPNDVPCRAVLDGLWVLSDGRVVACCEDWDALDPVGDVREESLSRIWNGTKIRAFREAHFAGRKRDIKVCAACQTSQDTGDHNAYPRNTRREVLVELGMRGVGPLKSSESPAVRVVPSAGGSDGSGDPAPPAVPTCPSAE
ncbi:MAG: SPASM domain-containing protein, partial [Patescibacteria group bacterium]